MSVNPTNGWGMGLGDWVWHPVDLPKGLHALPGGKPGKLDWKFCGMLPPAHRVVGLRQPGSPLSAQLSGTAQVLATHTVIILGVSIVTLTATPLTKGTAA